MKKCKFIIGDIVEINCKKGDFKPGDKFEVVGFWTSYLNNGTTQHPTVKRLENQDTNKYNIYEERFNLVKENKILNKFRQLCN